MEIYLFQNGVQSGPHAFADVRDQAKAGALRPADMAWYEGCTRWVALSEIPGLFALPPQLPVAHQDSHEVLIRRMADFEKVSGILWICLAAIQIISVIGIIAGIWNLFAGISRLGISRKIVIRSPEVPDSYRGITQLIIIGLVNLFFGGVIGVAFVAFDFYIRDLVLKNRHLFGGGAVPAPQPIYPQELRSDQP
jgi:hypothetical protein